MKKIIILLLIIFTCTGCWNYVELSDLGIVTALAISKDENNFIVDLQIVNIIEGGDIGISESPTSVISAEGKTVLEAIRALNLKSSKMFFSSNVEYLIVDKSIIKNDLEEVLDFLARDTKTSLNFLVVTSTDTKPNKILSSLSKFNNNSATNIAEIIKLSEKRYGASYSLTFIDYLDNYLSPGITSVYPNLYIKDESKDENNNDILKDSNAKSYVEIKNLMFYDEDGKPVEMTTEESFGYNFLKNHITNAAISSSCGQDKYFTIETLDSKIKLFDMLKNDKLKIKGKIEGEIVFYGCEENLSSDKTLDMLSKKTEEEIENYIKKTILLAKDNSTDFIGIGEWIYKNNHEYFDFKKQNWNKEGLPNIDFEYDIEVNLYKQGNLKGDV